jgi:hypothetical protein
MSGSGGKPDLGQARRTSANDPRLTSKIWTFLVPVFKASERPSFPRGWELERNCNEPEIDMASQPVRSMRAHQRQIGVGQTE